jgi:hypothetical protein
VQIAQSFCAGIQNAQKPIEKQVKIWYNKVNLECMRVEFYGVTVAGLFASLQLKCERAKV